MEKKRFVVESDFIHEGLRCVVVFTCMGHRCGYIGVTKENLLYQKDYSDIDEDLEVHGGITYSGSDENYPVTTNDKLWWFGFDTAHYMDGKDIDLALKYELLNEKTYGILKESDKYFGNDGVARSLEYCIDECKSLAEQLSEVE